MSRKNQASPNQSLQYNESIKYYKLDKLLIGRLLLLLLLLLDSEDEVDASSKLAAEEVSALDMEPVVDLRFIARLRFGLGERDCVRHSGEIKSLNDDF